MAISRELGRKAACAAIRQGKGSLRETLVSGKLIYLYGGDGGGDGGEEGGFRG